MATKEIPAHTDKLGKLIAIGDCVAFPDSNNLVIGTIVKLNPKMIGVQRLGTKYNYKQNKYPNDLVLLNPQDVTMFLLKSGVK